MSHTVCCQSAEEIVLQEVESQGNPLDYRDFLGIWRTISPKKREVL